MDARLPQVIFSSQLEQNHIQDALQIILLFSSCAGRAIGPQAFSLQVFNINCLNQPTSQFGFQGPFEDSMSQKGASASTSSAEIIGLAVQKSIDGSPRAMQ